MCKTIFRNPNSRSWFLKPKKSREGISACLIPWGTTCNHIILITLVFGPYVTFRLGVPHMVFDDLPFTHHFMLITTLKMTKNGQLYSNRCKISLVCVFMSCRYNRIENGAKPDIIGSFKTSQGQFKALKSTKVKDQIKTKSTSQRIKKKTKKISRNEENKWKEHRVP